MKEIRMCVLLICVLFAIAIPVLYVAERCDAL